MFISCQAIVDGYVSKVEGTTTELLQLLVQQHAAHSTEFLPDSDVTQFLWSTKDEGQWGGGRGKRGVDGWSNSGMLKSLEMKAKNCTPQVYK